MDRSIRYNTLAKAFEELTKSSLLPVLVGYLLLFAYSTLIFTECPLRSFKMFNGLLGVALVAGAVAGGLGLSAIMGVKFNATSSKVLPFLLMGLGVDDMFVRPAAWYSVA